MDFLQPSPQVMALFFVKTTLYLPVLMLLSFARVSGARGPARSAALVALVMAAGGLFAQFGPEALAMPFGPTVQAAAAWRLSAGGFGPMIAASLPLALSAFLAGRKPGLRGRLVDIAHLLLIAGTVGVWLAAQ